MYRMNSLLPYVAVGSSMGRRKQSRLIIGIHTVLRCLWVVSVVTSLLVCCVFVSMGRCLFGVVRKKLQCIFVAYAVIFSSIEHTWHTRGVIAGSTEAMVMF